MPLGRLDVEFRVLGPLEVSVHRAAVPIGGHKQRIVLGLLLLHVNEVVSSDRLIDVVWGEEAPPTAESTLRGYVSRLRSSIQRALGPGVEPLIVGRPPGYVLSVPPDCVDAARFEALVTTGAAALLDHPADASRSLRAALQLWRGPAFVDFLFDDFADQEIARLDELRLSALGQRIDADLLLGETAGVVAELQSLTRQYPIREQFHARLMRALAAGGRRAEALLVYGRAVDVLAEELGVEPGPELRSLEASLRDGKLDAGKRLARAEPGVDDVGARPDHLPVPAAQLPSVPTSFVGRHREVTDLTLLLRRHRLVTITGSGGSGKTRIALEVAADASVRPGSRVIFVEVPDTGPGSVSGAIMDALGVRADGDEPALGVLVDALEALGTLLVLDNCEHLVAEAADLVAALLARCPRLVVLATSRQPLSVRSEQVWRIPPLSLPDPESRSFAAAMGSDAVRLFTERAARVRPDLALGDEDTAAIVQICRRLDGLPLAIELAAARLTVLSPTEVADRLDQSLRMLHGGPRDSPERHRALTATLDWSYRLLSRPEQQLFERLSVFRGTFTLDAATAVCGWGELGAETLLDLLSDLVDKSLVVPAVQSSPSSFRLLETLRQYGADLAEIAGETPVLRARHAAFITERIRATSPMLRGPDAPSALEWFNGHSDDLHAVLTWLELETDRVALLGFAAVAWPYWEYRCLVSEGRDWLGRALATPGVDAPQDRLAVLAGAAKLGWMDDDATAAERACQDGLALAQELGLPESSAPFHVVLGELARDRGGEVETVNAHCDEAVRLFAASGNLSGAADAMRVMALQAWDTGHLDSAESWGQQCIELWDRCGDVECSAGIRSLLGGLAVERGSLQEGQRLYEESRELFHRAREPWGTANAICCLAALANLQGQPLRAVSLGEDSLERHRRLGVRRGVAKSLKVIADAGLQLGWLDSADQSAEEALARFRERGFQRDVEGALLSVAAIALRRGQLDRAGELCDEALVAYRAGGQLGSAAVGLMLLGVIAIRQDDLVLAASLLDEGRRVVALDAERGVIPATIAMLLERSEFEIDLSEHQLLGARDRRSRRTQTR